MSLIFLKEVNAQDRIAWVFKNEVGFAFTVKCYAQGEEKVQDIFHSLNQAEQFALEWCQCH